MSFFTTPASQRKRKPNTAPTDGRPKKRVSLQKPTKSVKPSRAAARKDEELTSDEDDEDDGPREESEDLEEESEDDEEAETAAEKRLRLAERYLENVREEVEEVGFNAEDVE